MWALALTSVWGCAATRPEKLAEGDRAGDLQQARIEYRCVRTPTGEVSPVSHNDQEDPSPAIVTTIEYPHPNGDLQSALVTVVEPRPRGTEAKPSRLASFGSWADRMLPGLSADERLATAKGLKISKQELDDLLREMVRDGGLESLPDSPVEVAIEINGSRQSSRPGNVPALERIARQVKAEGLVLSVDHPHVVGKAAAPASSDGFYQSLESHASPNSP